MTIKTEAPIDVPVKQLPLSAEQQRWLEQAWAEIDEARIRQLDLEITGIHSPTGQERAVSEHLTRYMQQAGQ